MALNIPNLNPVQTGSGGPLVTAMRGSNALTNDYLNMQKARLENQYYGQTQIANALSKMAYANLMGPQFLAKLMGNDSIIANLPDDQKKLMLDMVTNAGMGQASGNSLLQNVGQGTQGTNSLREMPNASSNNINPTPQQLQQGSPPAVRWPEDKPMPNSSYAENTGTYKGIVKEGEKLGELRAKDIEDLGKEYETSLDRGYALDSLTNLVSNPVFQNMRNKIPFFQNKQMNILAKIGTPEEQKLIGDFIGSSQEVVRQTMNSFKGRILKGDLLISQTMKVSPDDTFDAMLGKLQAAKTFNEFARERSSLTSKLMTKNHISKQEALEEADKQMNGSKIRQNIDDQLDAVSPKVTIRNKKTNEIKTLSPSQARKLMQEGSA